METEFNHIQDLVDWCRDNPGYLNMEGGGFSVKTLVDLRSLLKDHLNREYTIAQLEDLDFDPNCVNKDGDSLLSRAIFRYRGENIDLLDFLLASGADPNPVLFEAVDLCKDELVELLLSYGADPNYDRVLAHAVNGITRCGIGASLQIIAMLLLSNAHVDVDGVLGPAVTVRQDDAYLLLLEVGADANISIQSPILTRLIRSHQYFTETQLLTRVRDLLDYGADPNLLDSRNKSSSLHYAAKSGLFHVVNILLEYGAKPNLYNKDHKLPIDLTTDSNIKDSLKKADKQHGKRIKAAVKKERNQ